MFEVANQPPPLEPYNLFTSDVALRAAVKREQAGWAEEGLTTLGATLGKPETVKLGFDANKYSPVLRTLDRYGHRIDEVEFHPAWHELMALALKHGLHSAPWSAPSESPVGACSCSRKAATRRWISSSRSPASPGVRSSSPRSCLPEGGSAGYAWS